MRTLAHLWPAHLATSSWLSLLHLSCYALVALHSALFFPNLLGVIALYGSLALCTELAPPKWRQFGIGEALILIAAAIAMPAFDIPLSGESPRFVGWIRLTIAHWLLIPSRPGYLRLVALLAILGAFFPATNEAPWIEAGLLTALALLALASNHFLHTMLRRPADNVDIISSGQAKTPWPGLRHAAVIAGLALIVAALLLHSLPTFEWLRPQNLPGGSGGTRFDTRIGIGDRRWLDQSDHLIARLNSDQTNILPLDTIYLRLLTVPYPTLEGGELYWQADTDRLTAIQQDQISLHHGHEPVFISAVIEGVAGRSLLLPNGCSSIQLQDLDQASARDEESDGIRLLRDHDGNCFIEPALHERFRIRVDRGNTAYPSNSPNRDRIANLQVPPALQGPLRDRIPELAAWRQLPAQQAAEAIVAYVHRRCRYQLSDLPDSGESPGESLLRFLFGQSHERIGHCQYFSSAVTILLRLSGHPARPVIGMASNEHYLGHRHSVIFRARDAHAWVEWLETKRNGTWWHRLEATPPEAISSSLHETDPESLSEAERRKRGLDESSESDPEDVFTSTRGRWFTLANIIIIALLLLAFVLVQRRYRARSGGSLVQRTLRRQRDSLLLLANEFGIATGPGRTITTVVETLQTRSGIDLHAPLQAYLASRYGGSEEVPDWPYEALRRALRGREPE